METLRKFGKVTTPVLCFVVVLIILQQLGVTFLNPIMTPLLVASGLWALVMFIVCVVFEKE